jgi:hypothetical protein
MAAALARYQGPLTQRLAGAQLNWAAETTRQRRQRITWVHPAIHAPQRRPHEHVALSLGNPPKGPFVECWAFGEPHDADATGPDLATVSAGSGLACVRAPPIGNGVEGETLMRSCWFSQMQHS